VITSNEESQLGLCFTPTKAVSIPVDYSFRGSGVTKWSKATKGEMGRMVTTVLGMVADMELKFIKDRQRAGIELAKTKGTYKGRQKSVDDADIRKRIENRETKAQVARELGASRMTVYRALNK
jgi:DNA invertase Pin-like site-specific DNA recombinase